MLALTTRDRDAIVAACIRALPNEGCGLLVGASDGVVAEVVVSENVADSAKLYEIDPKVLLQTFRRVEREGATVVGVFHSHTHTEAYPSPTDVAQVPDPNWRYVIVSLRDVPASLRSFRVIDGQVNEEVVQVAP